MKTIKKKSYELLQIGFEGYVSSLIESGHQNLGFNLGKLIDRMTV